MAHRADGLNDIFEHSILVRENVDAKGGTVSDTPTLPKDLVNKEYVDDEIDAKISDGTAQGQMSFWDAALGKWVMTETSELFWDDVNKRLGIGTATPLEDLHIENLTPGLIWYDIDANVNAKLFRIINNGGKVFIQMRNDDNTGAGTAGNMMVFDTANGNVGIGTTTPQVGFHNVGTTRLGDQATNYTEIDGTGNQVFVGGAGLCFGEISHHDGGVDTVLAAQDTWYQMNIFSINGHSNNSSPNHTNNHITITKAGKYLVSYHICTRSAAANKYNTSIYKNNGGTGFLNTHVHRVTSVAGRVETGSATAILDLAVNDTIELWVKRTDGGAVSKTLTAESCAMNVTQIGG